MTTATAGQEFTYTINYGCSSTTTGCVDATLTDPVPAPLTIVGTPAVVGAGTVSTSVTGNTVTVAFGDSVPNTTPASTGLAAGTTGSVQVQVKVPDSVAKSFDGTVLTNTASFAATNADTVTAAVPVTLSVPDVTKATLSKTWTPASTQYEPGAQSTATLTVKNDSNVAATSLSIDEPVDPSAAASTFNFFDFDGFGATVFPAGADRVQVIATGTGAAVPGAVGVTPVLPGSVNAADVTALTFVFSSSTGTTIVAGGTAGSVEVKLAQRTANRLDAAAQLVGGGTRTNTIGGAVVTAATTVAATPVSAQQVIAPLTVTVSAGKSFSTPQLPAGESTNATLTATNTSTGPLTSLTVREPSSGTFFTSDVSFAGFNNASSQWPAGADAATVKWFVNTGAAPADSAATSASGLPATPTLTGGQYLTGFEITYTGTIDTGAAAKINFVVDTAAGAGPAGSGFTRYPNAISVTGTNSAGSNTATTNANLDVYFPEIALTLDKTITPKTVVPGGASLVQLSAQTPSGTSSVRPSTIVITEPQTGTGAQYWDAFDATAIAQTSVPLGSVLTIEYTTDGSTWQTLTSVDATAAAKTYNGALDDVLPGGTTHSDVRGLRFTFTDADGFGQATNVKPGIVFVARGTLRGAGTATNPGTYPDLTTYNNCARTNASGTVAGGTIINSALVDDCDTANVQATNGGPGPIIAAKSWDGTRVLQAQSGATTGVTLGWGTVTTGIGSMRVQDPAVEAPISSSVFQAFDLVRIDAITPTSVNGATFDPLMRWDSVSKVELYDGTSWQDVTAQACPTASSCEGIFPGYTLTGPQRASTQGVRLTVVENPNRAAAIAASADPTAPPVGSGVASASAGSFPGASADGRTMHLDLKLRNSLRGGTVTDWITGTKEYNVAGSPGVVNNPMQVHGVPLTGAPFDLTAEDHVTIVDPTLTTKVTKTASPTTLIIPQPDVAASNYPSTVYSTTIENTSTSSTWQLRLTDPVTCSNATSSAPCDFGAYDASSNPFDQLNITGIAIDLSGASGVQTSLSTVSLLRRAADGSLTTDTVSLTQATLIAPAQLADVVGVSALLRGTNAQGADGTGATIASGQKATIALTAQLRTTSRSAGTTPAVGNMLNSAFGTLHDDVYPSAVAADSATAAVDLVDGDLQVSTAKRFTPTSTLLASPTDPITVFLRARSTGTLSPKTLVIEDSTTTFWNAFTLQSFAVTAAPTGADQVRVEARTGIGAVTSWHGVGGASQTMGSATLPAGVAAADVTGLRLIFSKADGTPFAASNNVDNVRLSVSLRSTLRDGSGPVTSALDSTPMPGETTSGTVSNTVFADASYDTVQATRATANAAFTVDAGTAAIAVEKTSPGQAAAGREVPWTLRFKNTGTGYLPNPIVTDTLPSDGTLLYVPTNVPVYATSAGGTLSTDGAQIVRSHDSAAGTIQFTWPTGSRLAPGETYSITLNLQIKPGLAPGGTALNTFGVTSDRQLTTPACTALNPGNGRGATFAGNTCSTTNVVTTLSQGSFTASKGVKSSTGNAQNVNNPAIACTPDADGFYRYPCAAVSAIGATDTWKLDMVNGGNVAASNLMAIDVLPRQGDVGVVDPSQRGSVYTPTFNGDLTFSPIGAAVGSTMTWYVTTLANPCVTELTPGGAACAVGDWKPSSTVGTSVDAAQVTGVKMVFDFSGTADGMLAPGAAVKVNYTSTNRPSVTAGDGRAPVDAPVTGVRAWNSFGFYPTYASGSQPAGAQEPIKAGVILSGGPLEIVKRITGADKSSAPTSFTAEVSCTIAGAPVNLGGNATVTLDDTNGYTVRVEGIPLGARCSVTESGNDGSYGETSRSVSASSVVIAAAVSSSDPVPTDQRVTIVNDYTPAGIILSALAFTGAHPFGAALLGGVLALILGLITLIAARRRRRSV